MCATGRRSGSDPAARRDPFKARKRELFYLNITRFRQSLLDRKDRMSMAAVLDVQVPSCDHRAWCSTPGIYPGR
ncbi:MAG: asparagine synthase-related protein [Peptococcaceae bacterium MAG4]|nr:asparagine synthase-related protein [Peptococcaceae bacterium MAG4]